MTFDEVIKNADFLTIHTSYSDELYHMISEEEFEDMKSGDREIGFTVGELETTSEAKKVTAKENSNISGQGN